MKEDIFRKESLEKIESPDDLDKCVKVTTPKTWILLAAIVALLIGGCIWGFWGQLNTVVKGACMSESGKQTCMVYESEAKKLNIGNKVKISDDVGEIVDINIMPTDFAEIAARYSYKLKPGEKNDTIREFQTNIAVPDGFYYIEVITETKAPFSFVFNY